MPVHIAAKRPVPRGRPPGSLAAELVYRRINRRIGVEVSL